MINKKQMSLQARNKNVRVLSARVVHAATERTRPLSGIPNQSYTRRQMIINSYNSQGADANRAQSARLASVNMISQNFESERYGKKYNGGQTKEKEQMASQIMGLKQTVNRLVEQLSHQKGKVQHMRKKNLKSTRILEITGDERQWESKMFNKHLVSGIRGMYDELKQKYQAKCQELDNFIKRQTITKELQYEQYSKALEGQVKNLKKKIEKMSEVNIASAFSNQTQRAANEFVLSDLQSEKSILTQRYKQLQKKNKQNVLKLKQQELKIIIDQKLIDQKDNAIHALDRKSKELTRQLQKAKKLNLILDQELTELKEKYERQLQAHRQTVNTYQQKCRRDVEAVNKSKDGKIQTLEADNSYLHKMIQDLRSTNLELNKANQQLREENIRNSTKGNDDHHTHRDTRGDKTNNSKVQSKKGKDAPSVPYQNGKRIPQKADKKYNEEAIKTRKIQLVDVLQISQLLRLKLIAQEYSIDSVKNLFDFGPRATSKSQWQREYITMRQVKEIFKETPFNLEEQDALLISRYLIEDVQQDYVYCDDLNENHRQVVKSIIKTLIQEYPIYKEDSAEYAQLNEEVERYKKNLRSALKTIAKDGTISKAKLLQVMKSIGMEVDPKILQLILSKIAMKSKSLNALNYSVLF